jgi:hypothetical protein
MQQNKNLMPGQAKNDDFDNDDEYYYYQCEWKKFGR